MQFDFVQRKASLSVGEFSDFMPGPRDASGGVQGLWRAQLGTHWHRELSRQVKELDDKAEAEIPIEGSLLSQGWRITLNGRIDQRFLRQGRMVLREIKTVLRPLPVDEGQLRADYPAYFLQLACYEALSAIADPQNIPTAELLFVEADTGLSQTVSLAPSDQALFKAQLERVSQFLQQRLQAREQLRRLQLRAPFEVLREGQEPALQSLRSALQANHGALLFEAPTGFGKTGILLQSALETMKEGHFERLIYLTSKATGQLQVLKTLERMCGGLNDAASGPGLNLWLVRPKTEHCIHEVFRCSSQSCPYLNDISKRWAKSGVQSHYLDPSAARGIEDLRLAGARALVCPYEITRAALPFCEVWIGDMNYVFAPSARGLFTEQPAFLPARTILVIDEAHNLPSRVADAYSSRFSQEEALHCLGELQSIRAPQPLCRALGEWIHLLQHLPASPTLSLAEEDDALHLLRDLAAQVSQSALDYSALDPACTELLWRLGSAHELVSSNSDLTWLWWSPQAGTLAITCTEAAPAIGRTLKDYGAVLFSSATFGPEDDYASAIGLAQKEQDIPVLSLKEMEKAAQTEPEAGGEGEPKKPKLGKLTKAQTKKLYARITSGAELLRVEEKRSLAALSAVRAPAPWRTGAYRVAIDLRVDTSYQQRDLHRITTADTLALWDASPGPGAGSPCAVFFPSYAYAEQILTLLAERAPGRRIALQPRRLELADQSAWVEESLATARFLFLVLGSSFAEGIDLLGGRVGRSMIVGPALPEVNAIQQSRMDANKSAGREAAFRRVYQIPGMQKVNQALGRLVRAPGQQASVLLHCRRFADPAYARLLAPEYQGGTQVQDDTQLTAWIQGS